MSGKSMVFKENPCQWTGWKIETANPVFDGKIYGFRDMDGTPKLAGWFISWENPI